MSALVLCLARLTAAVDVSIAPDQPVPQIYVDDPLIIEFKSDADVQTAVQVEIQPDFGAEPTRLALGSIPLRAHGTLWRAVEGVPQERGRYRLSVQTDAAADTAIQASFCRVDRPVPDCVLPVCMALRDTAPPQALVAAPGVSVHTLRLSADLAGLTARVEEANAAGFQVVLAVDARHAESCEALSKTLGDRVARWDIESTSETLGAIVKALRRGGTRAPVALCVTDAQSFSAVLGAGMGSLVNAVVFRAEWPRRSELAAVRAAAERAGYEGMTIHETVACAAVDNGHLGPRLARQLVSNMATGVTQTELDASFVYGEGIGVGYVYLSALAHRLNGASCVGELALPVGAQAVGFRAGAQWTLAIWNAESSHEVTLKLEHAADLALFDSRGNPLPPPRLNGGAVTVQVSEDPLFLTGQAGNVLAQVARGTVHKSATAFVENEALKKRLPSEMIDWVRKFTLIESAGYNRIDFFNLLKLFPRIEEQWHTGGLPRSTAVPALADLARLVRALCVLEQEKGEPFVEPLAKTLANCGQFQSLYLTSSPGTTEGRERPEWLMDEVGRLMAQTEKLAAEGRTIEASGVAALAEWRARALEAAAQAQPLSAPEKEQKQAEAAAPSPKPHKKTAETGSASKTQKKKKKAVETEPASKAQKQKKAVETKPKSKTAKKKKSQ